MSADVSVKGMKLVIRRAHPTECNVLLDCWLRSVRATHTFVAEQDITAMIPDVRSYLSSSDSNIWAACDASGRVMGFIGLSENEIETLFLAPEFHGRGVGRRLIEHARSQCSELIVDVNEQNAAARRFYEACGFVVEGRSECDEQGRPYPLLHLRLVATSTAAQRPSKTAKVGTPLRQRVHIREYAANDWSKLTVIHDAARRDELRQSAGEAAFLTLEQTAENEGLFEARVSVAELNDEVVGFIAFCESEITWLYVHPHHYRSGVGTQLVRHALRGARGAVRVEVLEGNEPALNLYLAAGFRVQERRVGRLEGNEEFPAVGLVLTHPGLGCSSSTGDVHPVRA